MIEAITATGLEPAQAAASPAVSNPQASHNDLRDFAAAMEKSGAANGTQAAEVLADAGKHEFGAAHRRRSPNPRRSASHGQTPAGR